MRQSFILVLLGISMTAMAFADAGVLSRSEMNRIQKNTSTFQQNEEDTLNSEFAIYDQPHSYIEARGGYDLVTIANNTYHDNTPIVGGDAGYQFNRYTALEGGGLYFFDLQSKNSTLSNIQQWNGYGALKLIYPVMRRFHVFTKVGVQYTEYHTAATSSTAFVTHDGPEPYFAVGGDSKI